MNAKLTSFRIEDTRAKAEIIAKRMNEGKYLRDILAEVYVSGFSNKSMMQGYLMADAVIGSINSFESDYEKAKVNLDAFLDERLNEMAGSRSLHARCELWLKIKESISEVTTIINNKEQDNVDMKALSAKIDSISVSPKEATEAYEAHLYDTLKQTIKDSGVLMSGILENITELDIPDNTSILIDTGIKEYDIRAISSMLTYINLKNNRINGIPEDTTIEQVTQMVCIGTEAATVTQAAGETIPEKTVKAILGILGMLVILLAVFIAFLGGLYMGLILIPETVPILLFVIPYVITCCFIVDSIGETTFDKWLNCSNKITHSVFCSFRDLRKGALKIRHCLTSEEFVSKTDKVTEKAKNFVTA